MKAERFATLVNAKVVVPSSTTSYLAVDRHFLIEALSAYVRRVRFDSVWYLSRYPDVAAAIAGKVVTDGQDHYVRFGYWEDRMPYPIQVDEAWYLQAHRDVAEAIRRKTVRSAQEHFERVGYHEGRLPYPGFELKMVDGGEPHLQARPKIAAGGAPAPQR